MADKLVLVVLEYPELDDISNRNYHNKAIHK